jgi:uncharacterized protein
MTTSATSPPRTTTSAFPLKYVLVAFAFTWFFWWLAVLDERGLISLPIPVILIGAFGPAVAAVAVTAQESGRAGLRSLLSRIVRWRVAPTWYGVALLGPILIYLAAMALHIISGGQPPDLSVLVGALPLVMVLSVYFLIVAGLGEEVGWRGYALPALQARYGALLSSVILGAMWASWHLPLFFNPSVGSYSDLSFFLFVAFAIPLTILITWVFNSTGGSVLMTMIFHALMNASGELAKALPEYSARPASAIEAAAETGHMYLMLTIVLWVAAAAVVLVYGPRDLSRRPRQVAQKTGGRRVT